TSSSSTTTFANAIDLNGAVRTVRIDNGTATIDAALGGALTGSGSLALTGSGTVLLGGASNYTGGTSLTGPTGQIADGASFGNTSSITFAGATPQSAPANTADITAGRTLTFNSGGATIDTNGNNIAFAQGIGNNGSGALTKSGSGTLTLNGPSSY